MTRLQISSSKPSLSAEDSDNGSVDLKSLAQHLGLSKGTISRALNGYPEIADNTRARVLKAASELGYKPNRAARRLATGRNELIAYIGVGSDWMTVDRSFLSSMSNTLSERGFGLLVTLANTMDHACDAMQQLLRDKRVDGFVFNAMFPSDERVALAERNNIPSVIIGGKSKKAEVATAPLIGINDRAVLDGLVDYLHSLGHQDFAYFGSDAPRAVQVRHAHILTASCGNRSVGFCEDIRPNIGVSQDGELEIYEPESAASLTMRANGILNRAAGQPTAVFCGCERTVVALYMAARERGISIPSQLSIIGIGSNHLASWLSGGLSTVSWSLSEAGRLGAECVLAQVEGNPVPDMEAFIEAQFVARSSHGPAPQHA